MCSSSEDKNKVQGDACSLWVMMSGIVHSNAFVSTAAAGLPTSAIISITFSEEITMFEKFTMSGPGNRNEI